MGIANAVHASTSSMGGHCWLARLAASRTSSIASRFSVALVTRTLFNAASQGPKAAAPARQFA